MVLITGLGEYGGVDNNNIFAIGDYGTIVYYDGVKWNKQKSGTNYFLLGIRGNKRDNVYVVGCDQDDRYDRFSGIPSRGN